MALTIGDKILLHLGRYDPFSINGFNVPFDVCMDGIALVVGISRAHASIEMKRLGDKGYTRSELAHINGGVYRRKVFTLTSKGYTKMCESKQKMEKDGESFETIFYDRNCNKTTPLPEYTLAYHKIIEAAEKLDSIKDDPRPYIVPVVDTLLDAVRILVNRNAAQLESCSRNRYKR